MKTMDAQWEHSEGTPIPRWKIGLYPWRKGGEWRLRLYRPWQKKRLIEVHSSDLLVSIYVMGVGAGWWKTIEENTSA